MGTPDVGLILSGCWQFLYIDTNLLRMAASLYSSELHDLIDVRSDCSLISRRLLVRVPQQWAPHRNSLLFKTAHSLQASFSFYLGMKKPWKTKFRPKIALSTNRLACRCNLAFQFFRDCSDYGQNCPHILSIIFPTTKLPKLFCNHLKTQFIWGQNGCL